jgi:hypothetical protein
MHHDFLIGLNVLVIVETALTLSALAACLRPGAKNPVPAMRDYLILRTANAVAIQIFLLWPGQSLLLSDATSLSVTIYYFWYWSSAVALLLLEMRVAAGAMAVFFRDHPGLQGLFQLASRWIAITGVIVVIPLLLAIAVNFNSSHYLDLFRRWWYAFTALQLIPVIFALLVGRARRVSWKSRTVAILVGFLFEPVIHLLGPWAWTGKVWILDLANIANEIACCAAVALWTFCFAMPEGDTSLALPTLAMLRLDALAWGPLGRHQPASDAGAADAGYDGQQGAQPWPKVRRDA